MDSSAEETELYRVAKAQAGYFSARQARRAGFSKALLSHHVGRGKFLHVRRGVHRFAQFPDMPYADLLAAWLAAGEKAVVPHSALPLYGLSDQRSA